MNVPRTPVWVEARARMKSMILFAFVRQVLREKLAALIQTIARYKAANPCTQQVFTICIFQSNPCQNDAECIDGLNEYTCNCTDTGYEGLHCEINIDDCKGYPCMNGAECIDRVKDYDCRCYKVSQL